MFYKYLNHPPRLVLLIFKITQHTRDILSIKSLISYLDCGRLKQPSGYNYVEFFKSMQK